MAIWNRKKKTDNVPLDQDQDFDTDMELDDDFTDEPERRRRIPIIPIAVVLVLVAGLTAVFAFNVFNLRDQYILPPLRGLPLVGNLIPGGDYIEINGVVVEISVDATELQETVYELAAQIEALQEELALTSAIRDQQAETINVLQIYRESITEYRDNRRLFDEMVAMGDPNAFSAFFEDVEPDMAARLFSQIRAQREVDREFRRYARTYANMNTDEAAEVFTLLLHQNAELLMDILWTFNNDERAAVFNEMEAQDVAIITILMAPEVDPADLLPTFPVIDGTGGPIPVITVADAPEEAVEAEETDEEDEEETI